MRCASASDALPLTTQLPSCFSLRKVWRVSQATTTNDERHAGYAAQGVRMRALRSVRGAVVHRVVVRPGQVGHVPDVLDERPTGMIGDSYGNLKGATRDEGDPSQQQILSPSPFSPSTERPIRVPKVVDELSREVLRVHPGLVQLLYGLHKGDEMRSGKGTNTRAHRCLLEHSSDRSIDFALRLRGRRQCKRKGGRCGRRRSV